VPLALLLFQAAMQIAAHHINQAREEGIMMPSDLYETDFYAWTLEQSKLLKEGNFKHLDILNLVEEVESLGRQQRQELENRLAILLGHFLKWDYQPDHRSKSWKATIREQRRAIQKLIRQNPSLKPYLEEAIADAYESGLDLVVRETPLDYSDLPQTCVYTLDQLMDWNDDHPLNLRQL
jgi:hypothetical protein